MKKLDTATRAKILALLCEGMSVNSVTRALDVNNRTVLKLLADAGNAFADYQDKTMRNLPCKRLQADEIWSFVGCKNKHASDEDKATGKRGDVWTWTAIDADTKLMPCWAVSHRDADAANAFIADLASRLKHRVQLTTDGHKVYLEAVEAAFGGKVDYSQLIKIYGATANGNGPAARYSPGECCGIEKRPVTGNPDWAHISTSYVERANLTMRMNMRRFTRLTNAFSKKVENHEHAVAIYFMHYNFGRIHKTLRVTPAMEAGIATSPMTFEQMIAIVDAAEPPPAKRGSYKPRVKKTITGTA